MVEISRELNFAFTAGSSLPVTWRMPAIDMPYDAEVEELMCVSIGSIDSYDFHALEVIQCMAERRRGGETGVVSMQALRVTPSGKPWKLVVGPTVAGILDFLRPAYREVKRWHSPKPSVTVIQPRFRSVSG